MNCSLNCTSISYQQMSLDYSLSSSSLSKVDQTFQIITISAGLLLNCILLVVGLGSRQLLYPRHLFWIAIGIINLFYLVQCITEIIGIAFKNPIALQMFVLNAGVGYSLLLLCQSLAAFDRYLAVAYSEWYKKKITNKVVIMVILTTTAVCYLGITSPFWMGFKKISNLTINLTHMHWVLVWDLFLGILCVILHIKVFVKSRAIIRLHACQFRSEPITIFFHASNNRESEHQLEHEGAPIKGQSWIKIFENSRKNSNLNAQNMNNDTSCFEWLPHFKPKIDRLEIRAALNMSVNTMPFLICTFPVTCSGISIYWCTRLQGDCSTILAINPYLRNMFLLHVIYNPVMYMFSSLEFRRAFIRFTKKLGTLTCISAH